MNAAVRSAANAGVDSIEHAYFATDAEPKLMADKGIYLVPTDSDTWGSNSRSRRVFRVETVSSDLE